MSAPKAVETPAHGLYYNGQEVVLAPEPLRHPDTVIEATNDRGGMEAAWRHVQDGYWEREAGRAPAGDEFDEPWANIVYLAMLKGWTLRVYRRGAPLEVQR